MEAAGMERRIAEELADALGGGILDGLSTKHDVDDAARRSETYIRELELKVGQQISETKLDLKDLEVKLVTRLGAAIAGSTAVTIAILGALITLK